MDITRIYKGTVLSFFPGKHYGFLKSEFDENIFFYFNPIHLKNLRPQELKEQKKIYRKDDEVFFRLQSSKKSSFGYEAVELQFIKNEKDIKFSKFLEDGNVGVGFLVKLKDHFFIKDQDTDVLIPVKVSKWEIDIKSIYEDRLNKTVNYIVTRRGKKAKLTATLADRKFSEVYERLVLCEKEQSLISVRITGKNEYGYFTTFFGGEVESFIKFDKEGAITTTLTKGELVNGKINFLYENRVNIRLVL